MDSVETFIHRKHVRQNHLDETIRSLLLEALEEKDTERAVELFLAARLLKIAYEKKNGFS